MTRPLWRRAVLAVLVPSVVLPLVSCSVFDSDSAGPRSSAKGKPSASPSPTPTPVAGGLGPEFFGMHDSDPVGDSWPAGSVGALRVWDAGVAWNQVETRPGRYDFGRLDKIVATAREHDAAVLIVLGQTPVFHASTPQTVGAYGPGAATMPDLEAWTAYLRAMTTRYHGADIAFQVWNEANVGAYWNGTPAQMAQLTAAARSVIDTVTPRPLLVAPAMATRLISHREYYRAFYRQQVAGRPVADLVDVLSFQLYPDPQDGPEQSMDLLAATRTLIGREGVDPAKPIWNTEVNYGLRGGEPADPIGPEAQAANVARTYLLNAARGVTRVYWYSWDLQAIANTDLVQADNVTVTQAGRAFDVVRRWLLGTVVRSCERDRAGTWACTIEAPGGETRWAYWNPDRKVTVRTAFTAESATTLDGTAENLPLGGTTLEVGQSPVLITDVAPTVGRLPPRI